MSSKTKGLIPRYRFPEFDGEWEESETKQIAELYKGKGISKSDISEDGNQPCIRYGELYTLYGQVIRNVKSKTSLPKSELFLSKKNDVIIPASGETKIDIATAACVTEDNIALGGDLNVIRSHLNGIFLSYQLNSVKKYAIAKLAQGDSVVHLYKSQLETLFITIPPKPEEQTKIADCLTSLDDVIAAQIQKLDALKTHKKGLMQQLFPADIDHPDPAGHPDHPASARHPSKGGERVPRLRFRGFEGAWEEKQLGEKVDILSGFPFKGIEISEKPAKNRLLRGINITEGKIRHNITIDRYYHGNIEGLEKYKIKIDDLVIGMDGSKVGKNSALITKKDDSSFLVQRVARLRADCNSTIKFIFQIINSVMFHKYVDRINTSSGIPHISAKQINDYTIILPQDKLEQQKIADCLGSLDELIMAQSQKIEALKLQKKGLMQGLFPASVGVGV
ncbi:MAG: restriction endonuclease subunit S [Spirochaetia bacterium]|nr:restriction endonuclease subunit S [Spirochaetia bacterium]